MKIVVIGGSKGLGKQVVKVALQNGHVVTVFSRHPDNIGVKHDNLRLQAGDVLDFAAVKQAIKGQDAVICALGLPTIKAIGPPLARRSYVLSNGTENILKAMSLLKIKRLVCVTAIGAGDSVKQCTPLARLIFRYGLKWLFSEKDRQEELIKSSSTDWTIIRPTALTNGPVTGSCISEGFKSGVLTHISRADIATIIIDNLKNPESYQKALALSYPPRIGDSLRWALNYFGKD